MASELWEWTIQIPRYKTRCRQQLGFFYMHHPTDRIIHTTACVTPVVEHWLEREIAHRTMSERSYDGATPRSFNYHCISYIHTLYTYHVVSHIHCWIVLSYMMYLPCWSHTKGESHSLLNRFELHDVLTMLKSYKRWVTFIVESFWVTWCTYHVEVIQKVSHFHCWIVLSYMMYLPCWSHTKGESLSLLNRFELHDVLTMLKSYKRWVTFIVESFWVTWCTYHVEVIQKVSHFHCWIVLSYMMYLPCWSHTKGESLSLLNRFELHDVLTMLKSHKRWVAFIVESFWVTWCTYYVEVIQKVNHFHCWIVLSYMMYLKCWSHTKGESLSLLNRFAVTWCTYHVEVIQKVSHIHCWIVLSYIMYLPCWSHTKGESLSLLNCFELHDVLTMLKSYKRWVTFIVESFWVTWCTYHVEVIQKVSHIHCWIVLSYMMYLPCWSHTKGESLSLLNRFELHDVLTMLKSYKRWVTFIVESFWVTWCTYHVEVIQKVSHFHCWIVLSYMMYLPCWSHTKGESLSLLNRFALHDVLTMLKSYKRWVTFIVESFWVTWCTYHVEVIQKVSHFHCWIVLSYMMYLPCWSHTKGESLSLLNRFELHDVLTMLMSYKRWVTFIVESFWVTWCTYHVEVIQKVSHFHCWIVLSYMMYLPCWSRTKGESLALLNRFELNDVLTMLKSYKRWVTFIVESFWVTWCTYYVEVIQKVNHFHCWIVLSYMMYLPCWSHTKGESLSLLNRFELHYILTMLKSYKRWVTFIVESFWVTWCTYHVEVIQKVSHIHCWIVLSYMMYLPCWSHTKGESLSLLNRFELHDVLTMLKSYKRWVTFIVESFWVTWCTYHVEVIQKVSHFHCWIVLSYMMYLPCWSHTKGESLSLLNRFELHDVLTMLKSYKRWVTFIVESFWVTWCTYHVEVIQKVSHFHCWIVLSYMMYLPCWSHTKGESLSLLNRFELHDVLTMLKSYKRWVTFIVESFWVTWCTYHVEVIQKVNHFHCWIVLSYMMYLPCWSHTKGESLSLLNRFELHDVLTMLKSYKRWVTFIVESFWVTWCTYHVEVIQKVSHFHCWIVLSYMMYLPCWSHTKGESLSLLNCFELHDVLTMLKSYKRWVTFIVESFWVTWCTYHVEVIQKVNHFHCSVVLRYTIYLPRWSYTKDASLSLFRRFEIYDVLTTLKSYKRCVTFIVPSFWRMCDSTRHLPHIIIIV